MKQHLIQADIKGMNYWLRETGPGFLYTWTVIKDNATDLSWEAAVKWVDELKRQHCGWPLKIINK